MKPPYDFRQSGYLTATDKLALARWTQATTVLYVIWMYLQLTLIYIYYILNTP